MFKKGEKSLQMIFGLFLLLIISLVVLAMFFKFVKKSSTGIEESSQDFAKTAAIDTAKGECQNLCNVANDDASKIEFCSTRYQVDWDKDGTIEGKAQYGAWVFCEKKIPCFVLVPDCKNKYDGHYCRELLAKLAPNKYYQLYLDSEGDVPTTGDYTDGCGLPNSATVADPAAGLFPTQYNWKERFCFDQTYTDIVTPPAGWVCPGEAWD